MSQKHAAFLPYIIHETILMIMLFVSTMTFTRGLHPFFMVYGRKEGIRLLRDSVNLSQA